MNGKNQEAQERSEDRSLVLRNAYLWFSLFFAIAALSAKIPISVNSASIHYLQFAGLLIGGLIPIYFSRHALLKGLGIFIYCMVVAYFLAPTAGFWLRIDPNIPWYAFSLAAIVLATLLVAAEMLSKIRTPTMGLLGSLGLVLVGYVALAKNSDIPNFSIMSSSVIAAALVGALHLASWFGALDWLRSPPADKEIPTYGITICAFGLLAAFFMPWVEFGGAGVTGSALGRFMAVGNYAWGLPFFASFTAILGLMGLRNRGVGVVAGSFTFIFAFHLSVLVWEKSGRGGLVDAFKAIKDVAAFGLFLSLIFSVAIIGVSLLRASDGSNKQ